MERYFKDLTDVVETASQMNNGRPVIFITHSMGGPVLQAFFNSVSDAWKEKYVRAFLPVQGPWLGATAMLLGLVSGDSLATPAPAADLVAMERTLESLLFLRPLPQHWPEKHLNVLTVTATETIYTVNTIDKLLKALKIDNAAQKLDFVDKKRSQMTAPSVETYCMHGYGVPTPYHYYYETLNGSKPVFVQHGDGDGTVPLHSLAYCAKWSSQQKQSVSVKTFDRMEHAQSIRHNQALFDYIISVIKRLWFASVASVISLAWYAIGFHKLVLKGSL